MCHNDHMHVHDIHCMYILYMSSLHCTHLWQPFPCSGLRHCMHFLAMRELSWPHSWHRRDDASVPENIVLVTTCPPPGAGGGGGAWSSVKGEEVEE